jgi:hypothetical protein
MRLVLVLMILLAACSEQAPEPKKAAPDDGCVGYIIKPDGSKECVGRGK